MNIPSWKRYLSYLFEFTLEQTSSAVNEQLTVVLSKGRIQLASANAIYSFDDLYKNFDILFDQIDLKELDGADVLILGFGLGSVPLILEKKNVAVNSFLGVELDEEVLYLANKYTLSRIVSPIQLICQDAFQFVEVCQEKFDLVVIDVFLDDVIPEAILSHDLLIHLKELLKHPSSKIILNTMYDQDKSRKISSKYFEEVFLPVFSDGSYKDVHMNRMILNFKLPNK